MPTLQNVPYGGLAEALTTVGRFTANGDLVTPALGCVRFEGGPGHLMLVATDRYAMIAHRLTVPGVGEDPAPDLTGVSGLWPMSDVRRALTALRPGRRDYPMMRIEWHEHYSSWSTDQKTPDGVPPLQIPVPSVDGKFPAWRAIVAGAITAATAEGPRQQQAKLNPALLARLPGHGVVAHASTKPNTPALFTAGTSTVILVMPMRQEEIDLGALQAWADYCPPVAAPGSAA